MPKQKFEAVLIKPEEVREAAKVQRGDKVWGSPERDTKERTVEAPAELRAALATDPAARAIFDRLSYSHRNEYARWVAEAKKEETSERRAAKTLELLREGRVLK